MARQRVAMAPEEAVAFLAGRRIVIVGTLGADGAPDGEPARFAWVDGEARFEVPRDGVVHQNLQRDPRVVCSTEAFRSYAEIRGVAIHGCAVPAGETAGYATFRVEQPRLESFDFAKMRR